MQTWCHLTVWPSGPRRWLQAPVRKGVGSNPTAVSRKDARRLAERRPTTLISPWLLRLAPVSESIAPWTSVDIRSGQFLCPPLLFVAPSLPCVVVSLVSALLGRATSDVPSMCCVEWAAHSLVIVCAMRGGAALCWSVLVALPPGLLASLSLCVVGPGSITSALCV